VHKPQHQGWPKLCANWVLGEVAAACNRHGIGYAELPLDAVALAAILLRLEDGTIAGRTARELFAERWDSALSFPGATPHADRSLSRELARIDTLIEARGLRQLNDTAAIEALVDQVLAANPRSVAEYRSGRDKALNALVGQVMKASGGKANPSQVHQLLRDRVAP
jgi:aspartyl-tRNA(Asn)/glutamyl-tRNA(Gln) amidotransferase subunit B